MDNTSFAKALDKLRKADIERQLAIFCQIIKKFDTSAVKEEIPPLARWLASFEGLLSSNETVALHVSFAKLLAKTNLYAAECKSTNHSCPSRSNPLLRDQYGGPFRLPIEIWEEISRYLSRSDLKSLLLVPHPIREVASEMFWQDISLRLGVYAKPDFEIWHIERSFGIMTRILMDPPFACRVRTLKIDIEVDGGYRFDRRTNESRAYLPQIPGPLERLRELALTTIVDCSEVYHPLKEVTTTLRRLRLSTSTNIIDTIKPILSNLTHLELATPLTFISQNGFTSIFKIILASGINLESLRLKGHSILADSIHFRNRLNALPFLREFALHLTTHDHHDRNLVPAISKFLQNRPSLDSFELVAPDCLRTGFDEAWIGLNHKSWDFLSSLPGLVRLYMIVPHGLAIHKIAALIPPTVRSLKLSGISSRWLDDLFAISVRP
ncbi:hypothetical protein PILCRDRAFT_88514 [Piloderma croceum F 1598]|uniref:F-box domain-containing protein n=1 Tax=Piloderma croceum (strain F 1598) TaxID=765440 RepID=A0A0C3BYF1_PILCF|nr:hypothetical protein PILCRDRAFT_88514 [Piloderma croceum F 1598]